jgi:hypothetical protein
MDSHSFDVYCLSTPLVCAGADDCFMLNCCALLLRLAKPFTTGYLQHSPKFADLFTQHLNPDYYATQQRRLGSSPGAPTLSGQRGVVSNGGVAPPNGSGTSTNGTAVPLVGSTTVGAAAAAAAKPWYGRDLLVEEVGAPGAVPSFMADVFFMTQRHIHVGLMPAVNRWAYITRLNKGIVEVWQPLRAATLNHPNTPSSGTEMWHLSGGVWAALATQGFAHLPHMASANLAQQYASCGPDLYRRADCPSQCSYTTKP